MPTIKLKIDNQERRIMNVRVKPETEGEEQTVYEVPLPVLSDLFHINGVIYKVTYQRENPFRISAEPTGEVVLEVVQDFARQQAKLDVPEADAKPQE